MLKSRVKFEFNFIDPCLCHAWVATAIIGAGVVGGAATAYAGSQAADAQKQAAATAANTQLQMFNKTQGYLAPYRDLGNQATDYTSKNLSSLIAPVSVDTASVNDPNSVIGNAYQFINQQGQRGVTNSAAARGLGSSGAALKGAANFATSTADTTYQDLFNMGVTNQTNTFNRLQSLINTGENAAAGTGSAATATGQGVAGAQIAGGNATAAGINAIGTGVSNAGSSVGTGLLINGLYNKNNSGSGSANPNAYMNNIISSGDTSG